MAAQRQAGGGVVERDGFALGGFEQVGLLMRALDDRRVGEQGLGVDALLARGCPELAAAVAGNVQVLRKPVEPQVRVARCCLAGQHQVEVMQRHLAE